MTTKVNDCINHANVTGMGMVREEERKDMISKTNKSGTRSMPLSENKEKGDYINKNIIDIIIKKKTQVTKIV